MKKTYMVVGVYADNHQRWGNSFKAKDAAEAERMALEEVKADGNELLVAAVIRGGELVG